MRRPTPAQVDTALMALSAVGALVLAIYCRDWQLTVGILMIVTLLVVVEDELERRR